MKKLILAFILSLFVGVYFPQCTHTFTGYDSWGDGWCCAYGNGSYTLETAEGDILATGGAFNASDNTTFANTTNLSTEELSFEEFSVYPNPSTGVINISMSSNFAYEILDLQGRQVVQGVSEDFTQTLDLNELSSGVYLVKVSNGNLSSTKKLILK